MYVWSLKQVFKHYIISGHLQVLFLTFIYSGKFHTHIHGRMLLIYYNQRPVLSPALLKQLPALVKLL